MKKLRAGLASALLAVGLVAAGGVTGAPVAEANPLGPHTLTFHGRPGGSLYDCRQVLAWHANQKQRNGARIVVVTQPCVFKNANGQRIGSFIYTYR